MQNSVKHSPGNQRLFQDRTGRCILLQKTGIAISFWLDEANAVHVVERIEGIDFTATGNQLRREGWKCVGPGMAYTRLLEDPDG